MYSAVLLALAATVAEPPDYANDVRPILVARCVSCHGPEKQRGGLRLDLKAAALKGGDTGPAVVPGKPADSLLLTLASGGEPDRVMPPKGDRLTDQQLATLKAWIEDGAKWPDDKAIDPRDWWSLKPLTRPELPPVAGRNGVDRFVAAKLAEKGLTPSPEADRRTLLRRVTFDLTGLPPTPDEMAAFLKDDRQDAFERVVERLLASPAYGERWGRHWLDVVHYGDSHGFDKDKPRPNAWPYRDYVIRAFNDDKPYARFVREQLAGDVLFPEGGEGVVATGFIAAGPWDFVGQVELAEGTLNKAITRNLDRDDMASTALNTFAGLTVQCARCHDHKFDPVSKEDYYRTQAVFAAVDRADRRYDADPAVADRRVALTKRLAELNARRAEAGAAVRKAAGLPAADSDARLAELLKAATAPERPEFGYHSAIEARQDTVKWVQADLGASKAVDVVLLAACHDTFNGIGAGFGFPVRFKVELSDDPMFAKGVSLLVDETAADVTNPGVSPMAYSVGGKTGRYLRVTATKLAPRQNDFIFALAELAVITSEGANAAAGAAVTALDSIEAGPRWGRKNLTDGIRYKAKADNIVDIARVLANRRALATAKVPPELREALAKADADVQKASAELAALPAGGIVYAAATSFTPAGGFTPTNGKPRPVHVLHRGSEKAPGKEVGPGGLAVLPELSHHFDLPADHAEGRRRVALAEWLVDPKNPLAWRVMANRVWQYHFGRGLVDTPNDFGRMGSKPTHPELLDWLADELRRTQSVKSLHRLIVLSATYRQTSANRADMAKLDGGNQYLWRANRAKLEAEAVRDAVLAVAGKLDPKGGGPAFRAFGFKDDHSPHYKYEEADPDDPATHRRSVYRFLVRSVPDPWFETLDCADPSAAVAKRNETLTALQALALLNNKFMVRMAEHFAARVEKEATDVTGRIAAAYRLALGRDPTPQERDILSTYATKHGLPAACRVLLNTNEFVFVD